MRKNTQRQQTVQSKWLADFSLLLLDSDGPSVSYCNICRKYSDFADQKSLMFIGKIVHRMDTSHQSSAKYEDATKAKYMTGLMDKAIAMVKMSLIDMRFFSTQLIMYLETTGYFLTAHSYWKFQFKFGQGCLC